MSASDIIIVGGGMVGLATAGLFAREGFRVVLLEGGEPPSWSPDAVEGRVSALNPASRHLLAHIGVWENISRKRVSPYRRMVVWDSHSPARISFDADDQGVSSLGHIVENDLVSRCLWERLEQNYHVTLIHGKRVSGFKTEPATGNAVLELDGHDPLRGGLVVAADGAQSSLRLFAGIDVAEEDFHQDALTATIQCSRHHGGTALQVFTPSGPLAMLPLSDSRCSLVWSLDRTDADGMLSLDDESFCEQLGTHFSEQLGRLRLVGPRRRFSLQSRHATHYVVDRLALVGDAAHTIHPLAGLGANLGMQDAAALVETVTAARRDGRALAGRGVLRRYERWRRGENGAALRAMQGFNNAFGDDRGPVRQLRTAAFRTADRVAPLKRFLAQLAMGTRGDLPAACRPNLED